MEKRYLVTLFDEERQNLQKMVSVGKGAARERHDLDARGVEEDDLVGRDPARQHDAADAEVALVDADQVGEAVIAGREAARGGDELVDPPLLHPAGDDGVHLAGALLPDEAHGGEIGHDGAPIGVGPEDKCRVYRTVPARAAHRRFTAAPQRL